MSDYRLITDVTADIPETMASELADVDFLPMPVKIGEEDFDFGNSDSIRRFYALEREGMFAMTAQITPNGYRDAFEAQLKAGRDVLYLCFSSGLSGSWNSVQLAAEELRPQYPERRLICVDTLGASIGEGLLVAEAARKQADGMDIETLAEWVTAHRLEVCHWFTVDGFTHLHHGGRVSSTAAMFGSLLNIKPLLRVDGEGKLVVSQKLRGMQVAQSALLNQMKQGWMPEMGRRIIIGHGDCLDRAEQLGERVRQAFPDAEIHYSYIGPVIGAHTGPGMMALTYWGSNR